MSISILGLMLSLSDVITADRFAADPHGQARAAATVRRTVPLRHLDPADTCDRLRELLAPQSRWSGGAVVTPLPVADIAVAKNKRDLEIAGPAENVVAIRVLLAVWDRPVAGLERPLQFDLAVYFVKVDPEHIERMTLATLREHAADPNRFLDFLETFGAADEIGRHARRIEAAHGGRWTFRKSKDFLRGTQRLADGRVEPIREQMPMNCSLRVHLGSGNDAGGTMTVVAEQSWMDSEGAAYVGGVAPTFLRFTLSHSGPIEAGQPALLLTSNMPAAPGAPMPFCVMRLSIAPAK